MTNMRYASSFVEVSPLCGRKIYVTVKFRFCESNCKQHLHTSLVKVSPFCGGKLSLILGQINLHIMACQKVDELVYKENPAEILVHFPSRSRPLRWERGFIDWETFSSIWKITSPRCNVRSIAFSESKPGNINVYKNIQGVFFNW